MIKKRKDYSCFRQKRTKSTEMLTNQTKTTVFPKRANLGERGTIFTKNSKLFTQTRTNSARLAPKANWDISSPKQKQIIKSNKKENDKNDDF